MDIQEQISTRFTLHPLKFLTVHDPQLGYNNPDAKRDFFHTQLGFTGWRSSVLVDMANGLVGSTCSPDQISVQQNPNDGLLCTVRGATLLDKGNTKTSFLIRLRRLVCILRTSMQKTKTTHNQDQKSESNDKRCQTEGLVNSNCLKQKHKQINNSTPENPYQTKNNSQAE